MHNDAPGSHGEGWISLGDDGRNYIDQCKPGIGWTRSPNDELVLMTIVGLKPEGCEAHHKNGDLTDDNSDNLEWRPIG